MVSQLKVNEIIKQSGSSISIGESGDTITVPSGTLLGDFYSSTAFFAYKTSEQSISNVTYTTCTFDAEDYDLGSAWNTSTGLYTAPSTGYYFFHLCMRLYNTPGRVYEARMTKNLSTTATDVISCKREDGADSHSDQQSMNITGTYYLTAGQYVAFQGYIEEDSSGDSRILGGHNVTYVHGHRFL